MMPSSIIKISESISLSDVSIFWVDKAYFEGFRDKIVVAGEM